MVKFKTNWELREEPARVEHVDTSKPSLVDFSSPVYSVEKLIDLTNGMDLNFDGYDDDRLALSDAQNFAGCDPAADICDVFEEQQAIVKAKSQAAKNVKLSAGGVIKQQSQADTTLTDEVGTKVSSASKSDASGVE